MLEFMEQVQKGQEFIVGQILTKYKENNNFQKAVSSDFRKSAIKLMFSYLRYDCIFQSIEKIKEIKSTKKFTKIQQSVGKILLYLDKALEETEKLTRII